VGSLEFGDERGELVGAQTPAAVEAHFFMLRLVSRGLMAYTRRVTSLVAFIFEHYYTRHERL
jgi:hypothetical protein